MPSTAPDAPWNPRAYLAFASERTQPFIDLLRRVDTIDAASIVDLGCGPGNGMPALRSIWRDAHILGVDASADMLTQARTSTAQDPRIDYLHTDIRSLDLEHPVDLIVSNAALQWIPEHRELLPRIQKFVAPGGALAMQIPGNFRAPSHRLLAEFAADPRFSPHIDPATLLQPTAEVSDYLQDVSAPGWRVEGWETRYHHILHGSDAVFEWISSAGARPVLQALPHDLREQFTQEYKAALREAYPPTEIGTILPFRRMFIVARREA